MTANARRLIELLANVREASRQDGKVMNNPSSTHTDVDRIVTASREANYAIIMHLRSMTEEDLKSL